jgi:two-component system response regulator WspF
VFAAGLVTWLGAHSRLPVRLAADGDRLQAGEVLVASGANHLVLSANGRVHYRAEPRQSPYSPSIDVLFHSVAKHARGAVAGVLLTGMGRDGAAGLKALRLAGAATFVQNQATSAIYGMPKAAIALDVRHIVLPLGDIAARLVAALAASPSTVRSVRRG